MDIDCDKLTTCGVTANGDIVKLDFVDAAGNPMSLRLPFDLAGSLVMTLPQLLGHAVKARSGMDNARFVFTLGKWAIEGVEQARALIVTLESQDGFEVSFGVPLEACRSLAWALKHDAARADRRATVVTN